MKKQLIVLLCFLAGSQLFGQQGVFTPGDYKDGIYDKENAVNRNYIPYTHLREADVTWEKRVWRTIDVREKINQSMYYPITEVVSRKSLIQVITKSVLAGKVIAFSDEEFIDPIDPVKFKGMFVSAADTVESPVYDSAGNETLVKVLKPADSTWFFENFCSVQLKEDWFFDRQKSTLDVRILGMGFSFLPKGKEDAGCQNFFWVYFPAVRPQFAKYEVFNTRNDSERRTFEDVFWKRQFGSRVTKESNVYDRDIQSYAKGLDALLESDRVKGDIFKFEHDLWQF
jgi:gliding motility associated protien GldN